VGGVQCHLSACGLCLPPACGCSTWQHMWLAGTLSALAQGPPGRLSVCRVTTALGAYLPVHLPHAGGGCQASPPRDAPCESASMRARAPRGHAQK
jgi:hypothetical protein